MKRGDFYRVHKGDKYDPKDYRVYLVVSRQLLIDTQFNSVICAPVHTKYENLPTQVDVGADEGFKHDSAIYCDYLASIPKHLLTNFVSHLSNDKMQEVNTALRIALAVE